MAGHAADSSVLVASFWGDHTASDVALEAMERVRDEGRLIAHTMAETYATLSAGPFDVSPRHILNYFHQFSGRPAIAIAPTAMTTTLAELDRLGIHGGATYDALIAVTARDHKLTLLTLDRRAVRSYEALGTSYELLWEDGS